MKKILSLILIVSSLNSLQAKEGMWVPIFLQGVIMDDMNLNGLKLTAEDIYSVNHSSLKDAVVRFGGGCTAEIISSNGLLLTNHHCGYGNIQSHSSLEHDYLTDGYWANDFKDELVNPGLQATFIVRIEDVSELLMAGLNDDMSKSTYDSLFKANSEDIIKNATTDSGYEAFIKEFFNGNQHILFVTETFSDVRLVGAPPSSIGKYGFDTDNWVWPRHTGDFSIFRIYANTNNEPAEYHVDNIPYKPKYHFPISLDGYQEGDFTMVYGFPYQTTEYLTSDAVEYIQNVSNPTKIDIRTKKLDVLNQKMSESDEVRIKYAAKQSSTSNAWKKWMGQNKGLKRNGAIQKKKNMEEHLALKIKLYPDSFAEFQELQTNLQDNYKQINEVALARDYYVEIAYYGTDALRIANGLSRYIQKKNEGKLTQEDFEKVKASADGFYKNFDHETDKAVFMAIFPLYFESEDNFYKPTYLKEIQAKYGKDLNAWLNKTYETSLLTDPIAYKALVEKDASKALAKIEKDPIYILSNELYAFYKGQIAPAYATLSNELDALNKVYIRALMAAFPDQVYYPDANGTLRVSYGKIEGMQPNDAVKYLYYTTFDGVMDKYDPTSYEFDLPEKLLELHAAGDYGPYAQDGELRVCFIASNHTSGGNSGSPVINGEGQLIGLNFDRNWEGTMSDVMYDINQCRNISVDIRYVLFIIDKFAGAERLINEMSIVDSE